MSTSDHAATEKVNEKPAAPAEGVAKTSVDAYSALKEDPTGKLSSLSAIEWASMEAALEPETRATHKNLEAWLADKAKAAGIKKAVDSDSESDGEEDEEGAKKAPEGEGEKKEEKNWSVVNLACQESRLQFRGVLTEKNFTNWLWKFVIHPKLEESRGKIPDIELFDFSVAEDLEELFREFLPVKKEKEKDKKDDKKDKKGDKDKKDKKEEKPEKEDKKKNAGGKKKDKKNEVKLTSKEKIQVSNLIKNMIYGLDSKKAAISGWVNFLSEKDVPVHCPWEFQIAHCIYRCMAMEYRFKKKKEAPEKLVFYGEMQSLADAITRLRQQYDFAFSKEEVATQLLPLLDAVAVQQRLAKGTCGVSFDLDWYLEHGANLLGGSYFSKRHANKTTFCPFKIQELMSEAILEPGPQLVFGIAPPGTGKTAIVPHLLNLFPDRVLVFCCAALPVVLGVGQIANTLGIPYAFVKGHRITPSYACGRGIGPQVDVEDWTAVECLKDKVTELNIDRKKQRLAQKKKLRSLIDYKRVPRLYLVRDVMACPWLMRQLDREKSILVIDEPPMGSDYVPTNPEDNPLSMAMVETTLLPMHKTILMSATLPKPAQLTHIVDNFAKIFETSKEKCVKECFSSQLDRGVVLVRPSGAAAFPHEICKTSAQLKALCDELPKSPLMLKAYTERALSQLVKRWKSLEEAGKLPKNWDKVRKPEVQFADLSTLRHDNLRSYAVELLSGIANSDDDELVVAFCSIEDDENQKKFFPKFDIKEILFSNAYAFPGITLVADDDPGACLQNMSHHLVKEFPRVSQLEQSIAQQETVVKAQKKYEDDDEQEVSSNQVKLSFDASLVIHTESFLKRWCPDHKETLGQPRLQPTVEEFRKVQTLPVSEEWQMLALSGAAAFDPRLDADPANPVYTQWVHERMLGNKLACVCAGKEFTWGANVPASTIVVTSAYAKKTSVAGILQYIGRAARRGLTTHGQAIFECDDDLERIFRKGGQDMSTEADTMSRYAKWLLNDRKMEFWDLPNTEAC
eukprot:GEMP01002469.1.p1 GENE.GEMP01002469.1~~GEMP01002469.1.p1  ORF type:complete len:1021 (+),score=252.22 GEMP01002469.1:44-3106(+)